MVLFIIGLGLGDEKDITVRGLEAVRSCDLIFLESYTSILPDVSTTKLEEFYDLPPGPDGSGPTKIQVADRHCVESEADERILLPAAPGPDGGDKRVALLVVGDPVCATTHSDMILRARERGVEVELVHNASVMGAVGSCGLQLYNFGQTVSIPYFEPNWRPTSFYPKIRYNRLGGMHTLCLLDIKVKEPDFDAMQRGRTSYLPPRFMTVSEAAAQLIEVEERVGEGAYDRTTLCVGLARLGRDDQRIVAGSLEELASEEKVGDLLGPPLHSLVICGTEMHEMELEMLKRYLVKDSGYTLDGNGK